MQINIKELEDCIARMEEGIGDGHYQSWGQRSDMGALINASKAYAAQQWRPISEAPMDGTPFLALWPSMYHCPLVIYWADKWNPWVGWKVVGWSHVNFFPSVPTKWQPLPPEPVSEGE